MPLPPHGPAGKNLAGVLQDPRAQEESRRHDLRRQDQISDVCGELEESLEQLRTRYELYFVGVERREPNREREEMKRSIARIKGETATVNTGLRFRIDTLHARFLSYERMWMRTAREKEDGTYRRDLLRLRRRTRKLEDGTEKTIAEPAKAAEGPSAPGPSAERPRSGAAAADRTVARPTPAPTQGAGGLSPEQLQALYVAYVAAKKRCNEDVSRITYDALAKTVAKQVPALLARYKAKSVEFKVLIKDGKALLKAIPRT